MIIMGMVIMAVIVMAGAEALLTMESQVEHAEGVEGGDGDADQQAVVRKGCAGTMGVLHRHQDGVFGEEAAGARKAHQRQRAGPGRDEGQRHVLAQSAHAPQILFVVQGDDH